MEAQPEKKKGRRRTMDIGWEDYINTKGIALNGKSYFVNARELKATTNKEPRLLAKIDEPKNLPRVFREANYSLLAVNNGRYVIFQGNTFSTLPICEIKKTYKSNLKFELLTAGRGTGESEYIDNAFNTGMLGDFTNNQLMYLTIRGRERTSTFDFSFNTNKNKISVSGVQIEVDAGFEGKKDIVLVEAKIGQRGHFNIRQIYYPYRHFKKLVPSKKIRNLFFLYDLASATYTFYEFEFENDNVFDSVVLTQCATYNLVQKAKLNINDLIDTSFATTSNIIPQADDLNKVLEVLALTNSGQNSAQEIADYFMFTPRQSGYYREAAESLGLIIRHSGDSELTSLGRRFIATKPGEQQLFSAKVIVNSWFFRKLIYIAKNRGYYTNADVEDMILSVKKDDNSPRYSSSTISRRRMTIVSWTKWLAENFDCFEIKINEYHIK